MSNQADVLAVSQHLEHPLTHHDYDKILENVDTTTTHLFADTHKSQSDVVAPPVLKLVATISTDLGFAFDDFCAPWAFSFIDGHTNSR